MYFTKALVTGGSGFIGSHLVDLLIDKGVAVTVIDKDEPKYRNAKATYVIQDIRQEGLREIFTESKPEIVFHLAADIDDRASVNDPITNADHNVMGSLKVLEAARSSGVKKIVFSSTCAVYGIPAKLPITEKQLPAPRTPYGLSKFAIEHYLNFYQNLHQLPSVALRLANVYGPRQDGSKESVAISVFTSKLLAGEAPFLNDDGQTVRDYIHVSDVVNAFVLAAESDKTGVYNVGTKVGTTTRDLHALIASELGSVLEPLARPEVIDAVKAVILKSIKAKKELGWKPKTRLARGLKQTLKWYKSQV